MDKLRQVELYAWVGEDELAPPGSGEIGLKQALCSAGMIPMVSMYQEKMQQEDIRKQLDKQGRRYGKSIVLCRFVFAEVVEEVGQEHVASRSS